MDFIKNKLFIIISVIVFLSFFIFFGALLIDNAKKINDIQKSVIEQKQLIDNITRSSSQWTTKEDLDNLIKNQNINIDAIKNDLEKYNATIKSLQTVVVVSNGQNQQNLPSSTTSETKDPSVNTSNMPDPFGYLKNTQYFSLIEKFDNTTVPIGDVGFSASKEKPWSINILPRSYKTNSVYAYNENGQPIVYTKFTVSVNGTDYDLNIKDNKITTVYPSPSFSWFNPHVQMQFSGGMVFNSGKIKSEYGPSFVVMFSSYGKNKVQPDLQLFGAGVGYGLSSEKGNFIFVPVQVNLNKVLPYVNNSYVGPNITINPSGGVGVGLSLGVNF